MISFYKLSRHFKRRSRSVSQINLLRIHLNIADLMTMFIYSTSQIIWMITFQVSIELLEGVSGRLPPPPLTRIFPRGCTSKNQGAKGFFQTLVLEKITLIIFRPLVIMRRSTCTPVPPTALFLPSSKTSNNPSLF